MRRAITDLLLLAAMLTPSALAPAAARAQDDVDALVAEAGRAWDLAAEDAVLLLEEAGFTLLDDGRLREERRRIVWVGSDWAVDRFADLRIPWDSDRQTFTVRTLRVRRDGRWIDARSTAVVETTPHALRHAPDHSGLRETMLLHDGVEVPCVLECAYAIEDKAPFRAGLEGEWVFAREVPALVSRVRLAGGAPPRTWTTPGVPAPAGEDGGGRVWELRRVEPLPQPAGDDPGADAARVVWSTYGDWGAFGQAVRDALAPGVVLDAALRDSLQARLEGVSFGAERARRILAFVHDGCARPNYDWRAFLPRVRPAPRVWDTAYGSDLELAALAAALLQEAGLAVAPGFVARAPGPDACDLPTLARFGGPRLWVGGQDGLQGWWDPATGALAPASALVGHRVWRVDEDRPRLPCVTETCASALTLTLDLKWDDKERAWKGEGWLDAAGALDPPLDLSAGPDAAARRLDAVIGAVVPGLEVAAHSPLGFATQPSPAVRDSLGRIVVAIGAPGGGRAGGLAGALPHDLALSDGEGGSPVRLPGPLAQTVTVTLRHPGLDVVRAPEAVSLANEAGSCELKVTRAEGRIAVERTLRLAKARYEGVEWPALRALLLADAAPASRVVLLSDAAPASRAVPQE